MTDAISLKLRRSLLASAVSLSLLAVAACSSGPDDPYAAAIEATEQGDFQAARIHLIEALKITPDKGEAVMLYGKTLLALENPEGAAEQFKRLAGNAKFADEANALLAKSYLQSGNSKMAMSTLDAAGMKNAIAYAVAVMAKLNDGEAEQAVALLDQGLTKFPDSVDLLVLDAKRAYDAMDIAKARKLLDQIFAKAPNMTEARLLAGRLEMHERKLDAAKEHFARVVKSNPWNIPSILSIAAIERDQGNEKAAKEWINKAKDIAPGHPVGVYFAAQMAFDAGNVDDAHMLVQSLPSQDLELPALRMLRGFIAAKQGQTYTAITELERFFRLGGDNRSARILLAGQYNQTGANQKAWDILTPVLSGGNADAATLKLGASLAQKLGKPEYAQLASRAASAKTSVPYGPDMMKAGQYIRAGKWKEADGVYRSVLQSGGGNDPVVLNNASSVKLRLGDTNSALALARKAFQIAPEDPIILDTLGWTLVQIDPASQEGKDLIQKAVNLAPANDEIADHWIATNE